MPSRLDILYHSPGTYKLSSSFRRAALISLILLKTTSLNSVNHFYFNLSSLRIVWTIRAPWIGGVEYLLPMIYLNYRDMRTGFEKEF